MLRKLNDYESMLATMTCNVGMSLMIKPKRNYVGIENSLRQAWSRTRAERSMLQVKIIPIPGNLGPLGQRYTLESMSENNVERLFVIRHVTNPSEMPSSLVKELQRIGTTALDISKGSYIVECTVRQTDDEETLVQVVISLSHSLSDGPGALRVAKSFLQHLSAIFDGGIDRIANTPTNVQPLTDLQATLLGTYYSASQEPKPLFYGQDTFTAALKNTPVVWKDGATILPPEAMQNLPRDDDGGPAQIDCIHFTLSADGTTALRDACRKHGTTVQGALVAASIQTRATLLSLQLPVQAAIQVPVNTRSLVTIDSVDLRDECLCGSAGVWYLSRLNDNDNMFDVAKHSSESIQAAIKNCQPQEWLRQLFQSPSTLPPYSLMVSSIGVAPIDKTYGECVSVDQLYFFGGALHSSPQAQATMVHAVTFNDELTCMLNFTSPGVSKQFVKDTAKLLKANLISMANIGTTKLPGRENVSRPILKEESY